jgi:hypothetical protein
MQVNNVRIYLDSSSFSSTFSSSFFGYFAGLFAFLLGKPGSMDPDPTRSRPEGSPTGPEPDPKHRTIVTSFIQRSGSLLAQVPAAAKKANNYSLKKSPVLAVPNTN